MKNLLFVLFFSSFILYSYTTSARTASISGRVSDDLGKPLPLVSVLLLKTQDSAVVKTELTNEKGEYDLTLLTKGEYFLKVILLGYKNYSSGKLTVNDAAVLLPEIKLQPSETKLNDVTITVQKPFIEVHPDMLVVNVDNSIVSAGSSVMEVLQRSPGVAVDEDDNISLKGKQGVNIMIDGRIVPVSKTDLVNMLKGMSSSSIEKIEIISNPSAKYDAAGTAGIINIKTKKDKGMGLNGSANGGYGQGVYPKENAGFNLNYRDKKLNVYLNYSANYRVGFSHVDWNRSFYTNGVFTGAYVQDNYSVLTFHTNTPAAGIDYNITSKTTLGVSVTGENYYLGTTGYYYAHVYDQNDQLQSNFATNNTSAGTWNNYAPNIHLLHTFDSAGEQLTIDGDYGRYWNTNTQDFTTHYYALNGTEFQAPYVLHGDISGITQIRSLKIDYTEPLKNNARVEAGFKTSYVTADNEPDFYNRSNGGNVFDSTKSDHFIYDENITALYINVSKDWKKWSARAGLRAEQTVVSGNEEVTGQTFSNNYLHLFPSLALQDHLNTNNDLGVTLSRRIERPGYDDLNPYKFFVDPSTYKEGNPYLNPALTYSAELSHTYKQRLITSVIYSQTSNVITEVILPSTTQDRVTVQTKRNLAQMTYYGLSGAYTIPVAKWWNNITNFNAYYSKYTGNLANTSLDKGKPTFDINTSNKFTLPKDWSAELSFFYRASQVYGFLNLTPISILNAGIQKNMFNKQLTLRLNANDIFWHGNENGSSDFTDYTFFFVAKHDTRQVNMSVVYRFGNRAVAPIRKHSSGAEEEKQRAGDQTG